MRMYWRLSSEEISPCWIRRRPKRNSACHRWYVPCAWMYLLWMKKRASITLRCRMPRRMTWPSAADITSLLSILVLHPVKNRTNRLRMVRASARQNSDSDGWWCETGSLLVRLLVWSSRYLFSDVLGISWFLTHFLTNQYAFSEQSYFTPNSTPFTMIFSISSTSTSRLNTVL